MYFDAVRNDTYQVLFNDTREKTAEWLKKCESHDGMHVIVGETMQTMSVDEYLKS